MRNDADWSNCQTMWPLSFRILPQIRNDVTNRQNGKTRNAENAYNEARLRCWSGTHIVNHLADYYWRIIIGLADYYAYKPTYIAEVPFNLYMTILLTL